VIHSTAIIHPEALVDASVEVGPYCVVDKGVRIAAGCKLGPHVYVTGQTEIGVGNQFFAGCVIGEAPQDLKYDGKPTRVVIGSNNVFREHVTVHRATDTAGQTVIGSHNFLMANAHVGHNARLGDRIIMANGALLGGHVTVFDKAFISGNCVVHQYCRVGALTIMQGGTSLSVDMPPFTMVHEVNILCGLNSVGLRRAGFSSEERLELKRLYRALFRQGMLMSKAVAAARSEYSSPAAKELLDFIASSKRGVCAERVKPGRKEDQVSS
jgi:UDP-N-acetylglucosamine acyltransferase